MSEVVLGMADVVHARLSACFAAQEELRHAEKMLFLIGLSGGGLYLAPLLAAAERAGIDGTAGELVLEALADAGIVQTRGARHEYGFAQPVLRRAVVDALGKRPWAPRTQRALYEQLGSSDHADEDAAFLAEGYRALGDVEEACRWLERAVRHSLRIGLFREAAERASELLVQPRPHDEALAIRARILMASAAAMLGEPHRDDTLVADADAASRELGVEARLAIAKRDRGEPGLAIVEEALRLLHESDAPELRYRALVLRSELLSALGSLADPRCRAAIDATAEAARAVGSTWALLDAENDLALLAAALGSIDDAVSRLGRVATEAGAHHFGSMQRGALVNIAALELRRGHLEATEAAAARAADLARAAGDARNTYTAQSVRSEGLRRASRLDEARRAADEAVQIALRLGDVGALALLRRTDIRVAQGDRDGALADIELARESAVRAGNPSVLTQVRLRQAILLCERGDEGAHAALATLVAEIVRAPESVAPPVQQLLQEAQALIAE